MARSNSIVAVTIAKFATIFVEADTPDQAADIVKDNLDEIYDELMWEIDEQFDDSCMALHSYDAETGEVDDYMAHIWTPDGILTYDEYVDELDEQEEEEEELTMTIPFSED